MNIKLLYLYRDAGNYKNFGEVVFENAAGLPVEDVIVEVDDKLMESCAGGMLSASAVIFSLLGFGNTVLFDR